MAYMSWSQRVAIHELASLYAYMYNLCGKKCAHLCVNFLCVRGRRIKLMLTVFTVMIVTMTITMIIRRFMNLLMNVDEDDEDVADDDEDNADVDEHYHDGVDDGDDDMCTGWHAMCNM